MASHWPYEICFRRDAALYPTNTPSMGVGFFRGTASSNTNEHSIRSYRDYAVSRWNGSSNCGAKVKVENIRGFAGVSGGLSSKKIRYGAEGYVIKELALLCSPVSSAPRRAAWFALGASRAWRGG